MLWATAGNIINNTSETSHFKSHGHKNRPGNLLPFHRKGPSLGTNTKAVLHLTRLADTEEETPPTKTTVCRGVCVAGEEWRTADPYCCV